MSIYRFTMKKTMRSISTWIMIILPLITILGILLINIFSSYQGGYNKPNQVLTSDEINNRLISSFRGNWIWIIRILFFFFLFTFISIKAANIFRDEIDEGTLLIIVSKPISRWKIFWEKWLGLQTNVFLLLTISLWIPAIISTFIGMPSGAIKWLFTNIALTWVFGLFVQLIVTSLAVMLSLVMGSKGSISLFSLVGVLGFVLWIPSFVFVGIGRVLTGDIGSNMDGGLNDYKEFKMYQKNYPLLFNQTYKNFQDNDGNGLYDTFKEYYRNIFKDDFNFYKDLLEVTKRDQITKSDDFEIIDVPGFNKKDGNKSIKTWSSKFQYIEQFLLKSEWLRDYEDTEIFSLMGKGDFTEKKQKIEEVKNFQEKILNQLNFDQLLNQFPFQNIIENIKKVTFSINFKVDTNNNISKFKNETIFFWEDENEKNILKDEFDNKIYHLNYNIDEFSDFLGRYSKKLKDAIKNAHNGQLANFKLDVNDKNKLADNKYDFTSQNQNYDILFFTFNYEDIKNNSELKKQLFKKLISIIPSQILDSSDQNYYQQTIKNNLLFYKPNSKFFNPVLKSFDNSAILASKYFKNIKSLFDEVQFDSENTNFFWKKLFFDFPKLLENLESNAKFASNIKKNNIISFFNIFEHFEKMVKAVIEPNVSWGPIGLSAPYEMSLKFYTDEDHKIYGPLWEKSSYRGDYVILFTVYSLIAIFSTFSAFALLKFKNLT